ncbi:glycosyltransferase [Clostridium perfringens]|uniref:glycosyltransferase n=1 Tax=Clostridium perfringens TaxID=1502 RepID=UPI0018E4D03A|nr:glycosyltransferase [Clostridium perfringens]MBI6063033.1 glycosyltransferase [Clostridium perfringens]
MKKVIFLINTLGNGGAERVLVNLANNLDSRKYDVTVKTLFDVGINRKFIKSHIKYRSLFKTPFKGYNILFNYLPKKVFSNYIINEDYDIVVVFLHGVLTKIISGYDKGSVKKIAWLHADMSKSGFLNSFKDINGAADCFNSYDAIVGVSSIVSKSFNDILGFYEKTYTKYNTFDVEGIIDKSKDEIEDNIIKKDILNIVSVGKLDEVKGYDRLLRVCNRLLKVGYVFKLNIIGEGPMKLELQNYIDDNNIKNYVSLLGFRENPYKYIYNSDLFVCSSLSEGYSSVICESIILEKPVLTTSCAGMNEILGENNEYGIIVGNDEESLYEGLKNILSNKDLLSYYRDKSKKRKSFFSVKKTVEEVENLFEEVLKNESSS